MLLLKTKEALEIVLKSDQPVLLYFSHKDCAVCHADFPKVVKISEDQGIKSYRIDTHQLAEVAGQLTIFSVPAVLLFYRGKEYHGQARVIDFKMLEYRVKELINQ